MKESTARIGDTHDNDRTVSECFPCHWPEINEDKCHLLVAGHSMNIFWQCGEAKIWESCCVRNKY